MKDLSWTGTILLVIVAGVICLFIGYAIAPSGTSDLTDAEVNAKISAAVNQSVFQKNAEITTLKKLIKSLENGVEDENKTEETLLLGYLIDGLHLNDLLTEDTYSDRELNLFDGEVDFDGKDYDAEETLILKYIKLLANEHDFEGNVYMIVPEGAIEYKFEFESDLDTSLINEDETLEFNFLGEEVEISAWDNITNTITIFRGTEMFVDEGETIDFEDYKIVLLSVSDTAAYIGVTDSEGEVETKIINEGKTRTVNNLKIRVDNVFSSETKSFAELVIGIDIETEVEDRDEYEEDSLWEWVINSNTIGLVLVEDFTEIDKDGDEEFPAVGVGEKLCLPNEYVCVQFNGMGEVDTEEYEFELDGEFVRVKGNFEVGTEDYYKVYIDSTGIYSDEDKEDEDTEKFGFSVELGDTDSVLVLEERVVEEITTFWIVVEDFEVKLDLSSGYSVVDEVLKKLSGDEDYLTEYGILVVNPENLIDDQEFNIFVPEEKLEGSISLV